MYQFAEVCFFSEQLKKKTDSLRIPSVEKNGIRGPQGFIYNIKSIPTQPGYLNTLRLKLYCKFLALALRQYLDTSLKYEYPYPYLYNASANMRKQFIIT